jgi:hypothetical protein
MSDERFVTTVPQNLVTLHAEEERVRSVHLEIVQSNADLSEHLRSIEAAMAIIYYYAHDWHTEDQNMLTVQLLGLRLFNGAASALKLLLSGYFQTAAAQLRDLLETAFLLDYFDTDAALIAKWRAADEKEHREAFAPVRVRGALDKRDGYKGKKRAEQYHLLCTLATHPHPKGFRLLRPAANGLAIIGPFKDENSLKALLFEFAKILVPAANHFHNHFEQRSKADILTSVVFLRMSGRWANRFLGAPFDQEQKLDELEAEAKAAPD